MVVRVLVASSGAFVFDLDFDLDLEREASLRSPSHAMKQHLELGHPTKQLSDNEQTIHFRQRLYSIGNSVVETCSKEHGLLPMLPQITSRKVVHDIRMLVDHKLPAHIVDMVLWWTGKKQVFRKVQNRIISQYEAAQHFIVTQWRFRNENTRQLRLSLDAEDLQEFNFDVGSLDWDKYLYSYGNTVMRLLVKTIPNLSELYEILRLRAYAAHFTRIVMLLSAVQIFRMVL